MTKQTRRKFSSEFKARVALEAIREKYTLAELSKKFEVSGVMISRWKKEFLDNSSAAFNTRASSIDTEDVNVEKLYSQIGKLKVENDFLKKSCKKLGI
ncbi:MAG: transposase [Bacteroidia bacterium]|jgi:transposase